MKKIAFALIFLLSSSLAFGQDIYSNPSVVGTALQGQVPGTLTNDNACTGCVGEQISASTVSPGVGITTGVATNIVSINLTPGDWEVDGGATFVGAAGTTVTQFSAWVSSTSATFPGLGTPGLQLIAIPSVTSPSENIVTGPRRFSVSVTTQVFLEVQGIFLVSTLNSYGFIQARRVR